MASTTNVIENDVEATTIDKNLGIARNTDKLQSKAGTSTLPLSPKFTVTYSRMCDGGAQEMSTAVGCIREIFPDATIRTYRRTPEDEYGTLNTTVVISIGDFNPSGKGDGKGVLWSAKQRNLYQKYPKKRRKSIKEIRKALEDFKTTLEKDYDILQGPPSTTEFSTTANEVSNEFSLPPPESFSEHSEEDECIGGVCPLR